MSARGARGRLAIVLHTHMPYVEGFGTWPFGEEWLWEAMATSYLPLLDVLQRAPGRLTVSLTPVLCDQLEAERIGERFLAFMRTVRPESHRRDIAGCRAGGAEDLARELERSAQAYTEAADRFEAMGGDLLGALRPHAAWTSAATHAVLPLLATDAGVRLQLATGVAAHAARFGSWRGGLWLPECAHAPWLGPLLAESGARAVCVDLTDVLGRGSPALLRPLAPESGPLLVPIDRAIVELVWSDAGYPAHSAYRDTHRLTTHHHRPWANDGAVYDPGRAAERVRQDARHFVARAGARVAAGGLSVCAFDTELLGHWWVEGVAWLAAVVDECERQGVPLVALDDALDAAEPVPLAEALAAVGRDELPTTTWGRPRDLSTWDGAEVADVVWSQRAAELRVVAAGPQASPRALRELLALQSSDWAFLLTNRLAGDYPRERARGHARALDDSLTLGSGDPRVRNLAPRLTPASLLQP